MRYRDLLQDTAGDTAIIALQLTRKLIGCLRKFTAFFQELAEWFRAVIPVSVVSTFTASECMNLLINSSKIRDLKPPSKYIAPISSSDSNVE